MDSITVLLNGGVLGLLILGVLLLSVRERRLPSLAAVSAGTEKKGRAVLRRYRREWRNRRKMREAEKDMMQGISFLRNLLTLNAGRQIRTDQVLEQLAGRPGALTPVYLRMLGLLRLNRSREALHVFLEESGGDPAGREYASLLLRWDTMDPEDLTEIMLSLQKAFREKKITRQRRSDEMISDLVFLPVMLNVVVLFLNFLVVAFFLEQQAMLSELF